MIRSTGRFLVKDRRVFVRKKPRILGHWELFKAYMRPRQGEGDLLDTYELAKLVVYMTFPMILLLIWRHSIKDYPEYVEQQLNIFDKPRRDVPETQDVPRCMNYVDVIDELEAKRMEAIHDASKITPK